MDEIVALGVLPLSLTHPLDHILHRENINYRVRRNTDGSINTAVKGLNVVVARPRAGGGATADVAPVVIPPPAGHFCPWVCSFELGSVDTSAHDRSLIVASQAKYNHEKPLASFIDALAGIQVGPEAPLDL